MMKLENVLANLTDFVTFGCDYLVTKHEQEMFGGLYNAIKNTDLYDTIDALIDIYSADDIIEAVDENTTCGVKNYVGNNISFDDIMDEYDYDDAWDYVMDKADSDDLVDYLLNNYSANTILDNIDNSDLMDYVKDQPIDSFVEWRY